jgi:hypothetical protein
LNKVADLTNEDDMHPNDAIAKVAAEHKVPHGHVQLLVNAYNTGRTTAQRQSSDDVWQKAAEFPLADTAVILEKMYPDRVKEASAVHNETAVSPEYSQAPGWVERLYKDEQKAAHAKINYKMVEKPTYPQGEDTSFRDARLRIKQAEESYKEARYRASYAFDTAIGLKEELKGHFKKASSESLESFIVNSSALFGERALGLVRQIISEDPYIVKQAKCTTYKGRLLESADKMVDSILAGYKQGSFRIGPAVGEGYKLLTECLEAKTAYQLLKMDLEEKEAAFQQTRTAAYKPFVLQDSRPKPIQDATSLLSEKSAAADNGNGKPGFLRGFFGGAANPSSYKGYTGRRDEIKADRKDRYPPLDPEKLPQSTRMLGPLPGMYSPAGISLGRLIDSVPGSPTNPLYSKARAESYEDRYRGMMDRRYNPGEDAELGGRLDGIYQESMLNDLMTSDEVLSHRDPHDVLHAYASLRQIAPRAASNRETLRALLRDRLERGGAATIMELDALTKVEKNLRDIRDPRRQIEEV